MKIVFIVLGEKPSNHKFNTEKKIKSLTTTKVTDK